MADKAPSSENPAVVNSQQPPESDNKASQSDPSPAPSSSSPLPPPPPPSIQPYAAVPPSFRPSTPPAPLPGVGLTPMFSPLPNPNFQQQQQTPNFPNPSVQPPGVNSVPPVVIHSRESGTSAPPQIMPPYGVPGQMMRAYVPMPNGYPAMPQPAPQGGAIFHPVS